MPERTMLYLSYLLVLVIHLRSVKATKYCSYEVNGDPKYFVCARNEYCCNLGCCVHLAFQFYQLWYYWLLLIFMFMMCSGGSWWYKYCRQNEATSRYPSIPLAIERNARYNLASEFHGVGNRRTASARALERTASVGSSSTALDPASYHFHRLWKANNNMTASPNYYSSAVVRYNPNDPESIRRQTYECPYYQLYGPPPSYDSVVQLTETGANSHASCHLLPVASGQSSTTVPLQSNPSAGVTMLPDTTTASAMVSSASTHQPLQQNSTQSSSQTSPQLTQPPLPLPGSASSIKTAIDAATTTTTHRSKSRSSGACKTPSPTSVSSSSSSLSGELSPMKSPSEMSSVVSSTRTPPSANRKSFTKYLWNSCPSNSNRNGAISQKPIPSSSAIEQSQLVSVSSSSSAAASSTKYVLPSAHHHSHHRHYSFQSTAVTRVIGAGSTHSSASTIHPRRVLAQLKPLLPASSATTVTTTTTTSTSPIQDDIDEDLQERGTKV